MLTWRRLRTPPSPSEAFARVARLPWCIWLDSADLRSETGRWSYLAVDPFAVLISRNGTARWVEPGGVSVSTRGGLEALRSGLRRLDASTPAPAGAREPGADCPVPFGGGAAGFLSYELGAEIETVPPPGRRDRDLPDLELGFYDVVVGWNQVTVPATWRPTGFRTSGRRPGPMPPGGSRQSSPGFRGDSQPPGPRGALAELAGAGGGSAAASGTANEEHAVPGTDGLLSGFTRAGYEAAVEQAIEMIRAGDIFQVNLSQRFTAPAPPGPGAFLPRPAREFAGSLRRFLQRRHLRTSPAPLPNGSSRSAPEESSRHGRSRVPDPERPANSRTRDLPPPCSRATRTGPRT